MCGGKDICISRYEAPVTTSWSGGISTDSLSFHGANERSRLTGSKNSASLSVNMKALRPLAKLVDACGSISRSLTLHKTPRLSNKCRNVYSEDDLTKRVTPRSPTVLWPAAECHNACDGDLYLE